MEILGLIVLGAVVGVLARFLLPGSDPVGLVGTILVGVVGALIGYYIAGTITPDNEGFPWIASVLVAMLLLWIYRRFAAGRRTTV